MATTDWGSIYKDLGARPVLNATGSVTTLVGSTLVPEVNEPMDVAEAADVRVIGAARAEPCAKGEVDIGGAGRERRQDVKILGTSGYPNTDPEEIAALNVPFIGKPYKPKALAKKIRAVLDLELQD